MHVVNDADAMQVSHIVSRRGEKEYHSYLIRRSYRENGKVKHETLANISKLPLSAIEALKLVLAKKPVIEAGSDFSVTSSLRHGSVALVHALAKDIGLIEDLGPRCKERDLIVAMIIAQGVSPSSKLSYVKYLSETTLSQDLDLGNYDVDDFYAALDYLFDNQVAIEKRLVKKHISNGSMLLYDLSFSYMEGTKCSLSRFGYSRDKKRGKLQIEYGVLATKEGLPLAVRVFDGNTSDLASFRSVIDEIKNTHCLERVVIVGDRGMTSAANIEKLHQVDPSYLYVSALRSPQIKALVNQGSIQLGLFDSVDLVEITHPDYLGERLVVCKNHELAKKRHYDRLALLEVAMTRLGALAASVDKGRIKDPAEIGQRINKAIGSTKMAKHIITTVEPGSLSFCLDEGSIEAEAATDGLYVIRTTVDAKDLSSAEVVGAYKNLANVERAFRSLKTIDVNVRPVRHYLEKRVRAHIFLCMLSAHLIFVAKERLALMTFRDTEPPTHGNPVVKKQVSPSAMEKASTKKDTDDNEVMSFRDVLRSLDTLMRNECTVTGTQVTFKKITVPNAIQARAFELIGAKIPL